MNVVKSHRLLLVCILLHSGSCDGESERPYVTGKKSTVAHEIETNTRFVSNCDYYGGASDYRAGGLGFEPQTGPTLRVLK